MKTREEKLESALKAAMKSLATYGNHPIIEQQAKKALEQTKLDYDQLSKQFDELLENTSKEQLQKWLDEAND